MKRLWMLPLAGVVICGALALGAAGGVTREEFNTLSGRVALVEGKLKAIEKQLKAASEEPAKAEEPSAQEPVAEEDTSGRLKPVSVSPDLWRAYYRTDSTKDKDWKPEARVPLAARSGQGIQLQCKGGAEGMWVHGTSIEGDFEARVALLYRPAWNAGAHFGLYCMGVNRAWVSLPVNRWCKIVITREGNDMKVFVDEHETAIEGQGWCKGNLVLHLQQGDVMLVKDVSLKSAPQGE